MEVYCECKPIFVRYKCDVCKSGFLVFNGDKYSEKDDEGDKFTLYSHTCSYCGLIKDFQDIKYPYTSFIPTSDISYTPPV